MGDLRPFGRQHRHHIGHFPFASLRKQQIRAVDTVLFPVFIQDPDRCPLVQGMDSQAPFRLFM